MKPLAASQLGTYEFHLTVKFWRPFFLGAASSAILFAAFQLWKGAADDLTQKASAIQAERSKADTIMGDEGPHHRSGKRKEDSASTSAEDPSRKTIGLLSQLAAINPDLIVRLNLHLFDDELKPYPENWKPLGLDEKDATALAERLKPVFRDMKLEELKNHQILKQTEDSVMIGLPRPSQEEIQRTTRNIESAFEGTFTDPALAAAFAKKFIESHDFTCSGLKDLDRIVTVTKTSDEVYRQTGRPFNMNMKVLLQGNRIETSLGDLRSHAGYDGDILLPAIPEGWEHLFKTVK